MRLRDKFWLSNMARHDHGPKNNSPVAPSVTSDGYEEIHTTWFLIYRSSTYEKDLRNNTKQLTYSQSTQWQHSNLVERGIFINSVESKLISTLFLGTLSVLYPNLTGRAAFLINGRFRNDSNPVILWNGRFSVTDMNTANGLGNEKKGNDLKLGVSNS